MNTKAIAVKMEKRNTAAIMIFVLVAALLFLGLWRGVYAAEWKFTPAPQAQAAQEPQAGQSEAGIAGVVQRSDDDTQPLSPDIRAAVERFTNSKNCKPWAADWKMHTCNLQGAKFKDFRMDLPTTLRLPFQESPYKTKDENARGLMLRRLDECEREFGNLQGANISGADFTGANVCYLNLWQGTARGVTFANAHINQSNFKGVDLTGADFTGAEFGILMPTKVEGYYRDIGNHYFEGADLTRAKFKGATIYGAMHLGNAKLEGADFTGVKRSRPGLKNFLFGPVQDLYGMIWFDGTVCQAGSFGKCLSPSGVDKLAEERQKEGAAASKAANTPAAKKKGKK